ncbi:MAG: FG-GAP-like repeat-containing protein, partial [Phycisphaerales bacterium]|nr:FG-GAP-like repeat-containing protein [Phycisphaerales bacterium]
FLVGASALDATLAGEGAAFVFLGTPSVMDTVADWIADITIDPWVGLSARTTPAGDVNGDGYDDLVVAGNSGGAKFLAYYGSPQGFGAAAEWTFDPDGTRVFNCVATAGDVNGDGFSDVITAFTGEARLYAGTAAGLSTTPFWTFTDWGSVGRSAGTAGDVNGDGYSDVIVGDAANSRAAVFHGSASGPSTTPDWIVNQTGGSDFGTSVASAGDVNGDGYGDVIVGAPTSGGSGGAFIYFGTSAGLNTAAGWIKTGTPFFGISVASAGDVNGDGYSDVIVGENNKASSFYGSPVGPGADPDWAAFSDEGDSLFGTCVSSAGDVNGDGYSDVIVPAPDYGNDDGGRLYVYYGSAIGLDAVAGWTVDGDREAHLGTNGHGVGLDYSMLGAAAGVGDANGDGYSDIAAARAEGRNGSNARAMAFYGGIGFSHRPQQRRADDTAPIVTLCSSDDPGAFRLEAICRPSLGRGKVALEWEVKPFGTPLDGTGLQRSASWMDSGTAGAAFSELVAGLAEQTLYHWQARAIYEIPTSPFQRTSRWFRQPMSGLNEADLRTGSIVTCPADFDGTGFVDTDDFTAFVLAFEAGTDDADFDGTGFVDTDDFTAFVLAFEAGC